MSEDEQYMSRCIHLAEKGRGNVSPNPMVGAVLVHQHMIIGEGYHKIYGQAHAEVNCINSVSKHHKHVINDSTLYVSMEPCAHYGKTPPCTDFIIENKIPKVVIGCKDPFELVDGRGIQKLDNYGIEVITGVLENECKELNKRFFTFHLLHRPYIILKWAQSANGKISGENFKRMNISNEYSDRLVHKWRSEESAIMVGTNTAIVDNPQLTTRKWKGNDPIRIIIDKDLKIPPTHHIFNKKIKTLMFNKWKEKEEDNIIFIKINTDCITDILHACFKFGIQSIMVEGGAKTIQSFIDENQWDEARVICNSIMHITSGVNSPILRDFILIDQSMLNTDHIHYYARKI